MANTLGVRHFTDINRILCKTPNIMSSEGRLSHPYFALPIVILPYYKKKF